MQKRIKFSIQNKKIKVITVVSLEFGCTEVKLKPQQTSQTIAYSAETKGKMWSFCRGVCLRLQLSSLAVDFFAISKP